MIVQNIRNGTSDGRYKTIVNTTPNVRLTNSPTILSLTKLSIPAKLYPLRLSNSRLTDYRPLHIAAATTAYDVTLTHQSRAPKCREGWDKDACADHSTYTSRTLAIYRLRGHRLSSSVPGQYDTPIVPSSW